MQFKIIVDAEKLEEHTYRKCRSTRVFPKKDRGALPNVMTNEAIEILGDVIEANDCSLKVEEERNLRAKLQRRAMRKCKVLEHHIRVIHRVGNIDSAEYEYWACMAEGLRNQIAAWRKSDRQRLRA